MLLVRCVSGQVWEFPVTTVAKEPQVDYVIVIEASEIGKTSTVGFRLTSTTRRAEAFTAAFLPGSSSEFAVTPASGVLPAADSRGALVNVSFTPARYSKRHRVRLVIQAGDMRWSYDVRGITPHDPQHLSATSNGSASVLRLVSQRRPNFVAWNLRLPALANSCTLRARERARKREMEVEVEKKQTSSSCPE